MPYTLNGCGAKYYGQRYPAEDGSYVATLWVTLVWIPLLPLRSYRVRPVGQGKNYIVHQSQGYQSVRVPFCWPQVRNVFCFTVPILALILYFNASDIQKWWKNDVLKSTSRPLLKQEPLPEQDLPLDSSQAAVACGKVLKLDKPAFAKLGVFARLSQVVTDSGFTEAEVKEYKPTMDLQEMAFSAYAVGYLTWEKPADVSTASLDTSLSNAVDGVDLKKLSPAERDQFNALVVRVKRMMLKSFDLGRHDAKISPCPWRS